MDLGLRNARINFRQNERTHLMENLVYNELRARSFNVDVGSVSSVGTNSEGKRLRSTLEVDCLQPEAEDTTYSRLTECPPKRNWNRSAHRCYA